MATQPELDTQQASVAQLMSGILADAQDLLRQQLALFRLEVQAEVRKTRDAGALIAVGAVAAVVGVLLLCLMAVHLLAWVFPDLPVWVCYAIVGLPILVVGAALCYVGLNRLGPAPPPCETPVPARSLKENLDG